MTWRWVRGGNRPRRVVQAGFGLVALGEVLRIALALTERDPLPRVADGALLFLAGHLAVAGGAVALCRRTAGHESADDLADLGLVVVPTIALGWVLVLHPLLRRHVDDPVVATSSSALGAVAIATGALALRLWFGARRDGATRAAASSIGLLSMSTLARIAADLSGHGGVGGLAHAARFGALALAVVALPRLHRTQGRRRPEPVLSPRRLFVLLLASLVMPVALATLAAARRDLHRVDVVFLAASIAATIGLVIARLWSAARLIGAVAEHRGERRARALLRDSHDVVAIVDSAGYVTFANPAMEKVLGYRPSEFIGRHIGVLATDEMRDTVGQAFATLCQTPAGTAHSYELPAQTAHGETVLLELTGLNKLDDPDVRGVILTGRDITQRRELENQLTFSATHDPLTQLANRTLFFRRLEAGIRYVETDRSHRAAVISIDLTTSRR